VLLLRQAMGLLADKGAMCIPPGLGTAGNALERLEQALQEIHVHFALVVPDPVCELRFAANKFALATALSNEFVPIVPSAPVVAAAAGVSTKQLVDDAMTELLKIYPAFAAAVREHGLFIKPARLADAGQGVAIIAPGATHAVYASALARACLLGDFAYMQPYLPRVFQREITVYLVAGAPLLAEHWQFTGSPQLGVERTLTKTFCPVLDGALRLVAHDAVRALAVATRKAAGGRPGSDLEYPPLAAVDLVCVGGRPAVYELEIGTIVVDAARRPGLLSLDRREVVAHSTATCP
jgi:hypothetical protein